MNWDDIKGVLSKIAPMIATGLGGPLAGAAYTALSGVFGISPTGTTADIQDSLVAAITGATPDQLLAIKKADQDYRLQMETLGFKNEEALEAIASTDRDSARKREIEVKDNTPKILAYAITLGYFAALACVIFVDMPSKDKEILYMMVGTLGTAWVGVINYYYGSTAGSRAKSELLAKSTPTV